MIPIEDVAGQWPPLRASLTRPTEGYRAPTVVNRLARSFDLCGLNLEEARSLCTRRLADRTNGLLQVDGNQTWQIVEQCLRQDAMDLLLDVMAEMTEDTTELAVLRTAVELRLPGSTLTSLQLSWLLTILNGLGSHQIGQVVNDPTLAAHMAGLDPADLENLIRNLQNLPGNQNVPPLLVLLERVAHVAGSELIKQDLHGLVDYLGERMNWPRSMIRGVCLASGGAAGIPRSESFLMIRLRLGGTHSDKFLVQASCAKSATAVEKGLRRPKKAMTKPELVTFIGECIQTLVDRQGYDLDDLTVEFCLPRELLNEPVDRYFVEHRDGTGALGERHRVVVRSVERGSMNGTHSTWRRSGQRLDSFAEAPPRDAVAVFPSSEVESDLVFVTVSRNGDDLPVCVLLLSPPAAPTPSRRDAFRGCWEGGVPIMIWPGPGLDPADFEAWALDRIAAGGLRSLPRTVLRARQDARRSGASIDVSLLYDDATRIPAIIRPTRFRTPDVASN